MTIYFDFEEQRRMAEVTWPENEGSIQVTLTDDELIKKLPADLIYDINGRRKVTFIEENPDNKRLIRLQKVIGRKLQEFVNKL